MVRPGTAGGADRWFQIKTQIHSKLLNSLTPDQLKTLNKEGVREQIGVVVERMVKDESVPMTVAERESKRFSMKSSGWARSSLCSRTPR